MKLSVLLGSGQRRFYAEIGGANGAQGWEDVLMELADDVPSGLVSGDGDYLSRARARSSNAKVRASAPHHLAEVACLGV